MVFGCNVLALSLAHFLLFKGYNGTDDLHYAQLASQWLQGSYNPFEPADIFSGRVLHIGWQALWFGIIGIGDTAILLPPLLALVTMAYLVCFQFFKHATASAVFFISALCFFNPFTPTLLLGNMPDVYLGLAATVLFLVYSKARQATIGWPMAIAAMALVSVAAWLIKETIAYPVLCISVLMVWERKRLGYRVLWAYVAAMALAALALLAWYSLYTGNPWFRWQQIQSGSYLNPCQYGAFSTAYLLDRITIGIPKLLVAEGIFPLLMLLPFLLWRWRFMAQPSIPALAVLVLLALVWWLPLSWMPYGPLCHKYRHYFFVVPVALWYLQQRLNAPPGFDSFFKPSGVWIATWLLAAAVCFYFSPYRHWLAKVYLIFLLVSVVLYCCKAATHWFMYTYGILFFASMVYPMLRTADRGYNDLKILYGKIEKAAPYAGMHVYFIDHDTKSHIQFISGFTPRLQVSCLDSSEYPVFKRYDAKTTSTNRVAPFTQTWLITNKAYTSHAAHHFYSIDSLAVKHQWPQWRSGATRAYFLPNNEAIAQIASIANRH